MKAIVVQGNLSDGFRFVGPFDDFDAAAFSIEGNDGETWIATLHEPEVEDARGPMGLFQMGRGEAPHEDAGPAEAGRSGAAAALAGGGVPDGTRAPDDAAPSEGSGDVQT